MNVLEAKDLSFAYGNTPVLDAASFTMLSLIHIS